MLIPKLKIKQAIYYTLPPITSGTTFARFLKLDANAGTPSSPCMRISCIKLLI